MMWSCLKCRDQFGGGTGTHWKWCDKREAHFWSKVDKNGAGGCWLFTGTISFEGYGRVNIGGVHMVQYQSHRYVWTLLKGPIPDGLCVLHTCDVRHCVNPEHLYLGARKDNMRDKIMRRRDPTAVLTYEQAAEVKAALANYRHGMNVELARKYGVSTAVIQGIKSGRSYRHVSPAAANNPKSE